VQRLGIGMTDDIATTTNRTCQWSSAKQMFRNYWPSHDIVTFFQKIYYQGNNDY